MSIVNSLLFFIFFYILHQNISIIANSLSDYLIKFFIGFVACVIPTGFLLSELNEINNPDSWNLWTIIFALTFALIVAFFGDDFNINSFLKQYKKNFPNQSKKKPVFLKIASIISKIFFFFILKRAFRKEKFSLKKAIQATKNNLLTTWRNSNFSSKFIFGILSTTLVFTTIVNLITIVIAVPNEWDSLTGHLVKCAYYLQNGNMNRVGGTMWSVDYYPNSLPTLQIFGYHLFHSEKGFKLIHWLAYWAFAVASYGTAKKIAPQPPMGELSNGALFVFLVTSLLPTALVQATTTETDIVLTAYLACLVYFMFSPLTPDGRTKKHSNLDFIFIGLTICIALGHKITFLLISPAIAVVGIYTMLASLSMGEGLGERFFKKLFPLLLTLGIGFFIYVLPTGYIGNIKEGGKFGISSITGPKEVMNWFRPEAYTTKDMLKYGTLNVGRYTSDFLNLDGIRATKIGKEVNGAMRYLPNKVFEKLPLEQDKFWAVSPFYIKNPPIEFHQERPYWGIISFGLVLPIIIFLWFGFRKNWQNPGRRSLMVLSIAAMIHFLSLCYTAAYDPIKGRYFMNMAVWCMPLLSPVATVALIPRGGKSKLPLLGVGGLALIISLSAICTVFVKRIHPILAERNIFNMNRMEMMTLTRPDIYEAYKKYDEIVPKNATVALGTTREDFEYPLWGEGFTRKLIPLHPFGKAVKAIPAEANYLFYTKGVLPYQAGDIQLNAEDKNNDTPVKENVYFIRPVRRSPLPPEGE